MDGMGGRMLGSKTELVIWNYFFFGADLRDEVVDYGFVDFANCRGKTDNSVARWVGGIFAFFEDRENFGTFPLLRKVV